MLLLSISKKNPALSKAEVKALYPIVLEQHEDSIIVTGRSRRYRRLAFTKAAYNILFACRQKEIISMIQTHHWNRVIRESYNVEADKEERSIQTAIWKRVSNPCVALKNPEIIIHFFFRGDTVYATKRLWKNDNLFMHRKAHTRPGFYPASLDPQLARCLVNLGGISCTIVDPFCGTGGILIEAALLGHRCYGYDIDTKMLEKCRQNIMHYTLQKNVQLNESDATHFYKRCGAIVTEPPFGKNTKTQQLETLYFDFLVNARRSTKKIVITFPHWVAWGNIVKKSGWKIVHCFDWYVHKSMTRKIVVLETVLSTGVFTSGY